MKCSAFFLLLLLLSSVGSAAEITLKINKKYLNFPISNQQDRKKMTFLPDASEPWSVVVRLAPDKEDYWVFYDVSHLMGKNLKISADVDEKTLKKIYQADEIHGQDSIYQEKNRPQYHFSTKRGWINDPNGLVFYDGEYHLFYQHNPMETEWENMHWGHAVSADLIHWKELPTALYPDKLGTMFSGSAIIDYQNHAGYNKGKQSAMIAFYTAASDARQVQCMAYSLDKGRTWTKYNKNPIIDSKEKWNSQDTRDPKVFWYEPSKHWVMILNERDGHSIYTANDLKNWTYQSHVSGFWECPELFELPIDGNPNNKKWVMYGATGTYMLGSFDGKVFSPEAGKYFYNSGKLYAAQTYSNIPENDGRRIQIGWGRIQQPNMPFNGMMMLPTELSLRTTKDGPRLFNNPIKETEQLFSKIDSWKNLTSSKANELLHQFSDYDKIRIRTKIKLSHATEAGFNLYAQRMISYDMNANILNTMFYSPQDPTSMELSADIYIDRTSIEVFFDNGIYTSYLERKPDPNNQEGFHFWGNNIEILELEVFEIKGIWK